MHDICRAAGVSAGALYVYFASKEDLIAGICERDRAKLAGELTQLADAPDLVSALGKLAQHYAVDQPVYKRLIVLEMGIESTRNPAIASIFRSVDQFVIESFAKLFERARQQGRIAPHLDTQTLARVVATIGDGMFWRRAIDPTHNPQSLVTVLLGVISTLLNPTQPLHHPAPVGTPMKALI